MKHPRRGGKKPVQVEKPRDFCGARLFVEHKWRGADAKVWAFFWLDSRPYLANEDDA